MEFLFSSLLFIILGLLLFFLDKKFGTSWNRYWYNLTHKQPRAGGLEKGYIAGRKIRMRLIVSAISVLFIFILMMLTNLFNAFQLNPFQVMAFGLLGIPAVLIGMYIGNAITGGGKGKVDKALDYIEKVEEGEANVKKDLIKGATKVGKEFNEIKTKVTDQFKKEESEEVAKPPKPEPKDEEIKENPEEKKDWRKGIDDFLNK